MRKYVYAVVVMLSLISCSAHASEATPAQMSLYNEIVLKLQTILDTFNSSITQSSSSSQVASAVVSGTGVGQRAQLKSSISTYPIRSSGSQGSKIIANQPKGAIGTVTYGPSTQTITTYPPGCNTDISTAIVGTVCVPTYSYLYWMRVNFDSGVDGWVEQKYLMPAASTEFTVDAPLFVPAQATVRSTPNGTSVGTQGKNAIGVITGSPVSAGSKVWWPVNFTSGVDGWVDQSTIKNEGVLLTNIPAPKAVTITDPILKDPVLADYTAKTLNLTKEQLINAAKNLNGISMSQPYTFTNDDGKEYIVLSVQDAELNEHVIGYHKDPVTGQERALMLVRKDDGSDVGYVTLSLDSDRSTDKVYADIDYNKDKVVDDVLVFNVIDVDGVGTVGTIGRPRSDGTLEVIHATDPVFFDQETINEWFRKLSPPLDPASIVPFESGGADDQETPVFGTLVELDPDAPIDTQTITITDGRGEVEARVNDYSIYADPSFWYQGDTRGYARYQDTMELADYYLQMFLSRNGAKLPN